MRLDCYIKGCKRNKVTRNYYYQKMEKRHVRAAYFVELYEFKIAGNNTSWFPKENDSDGVYWMLAYWTGRYCGYIE